MTDVGGVKVIEGEVGLDVDGGVEGCCFNCMVGDICCGSIGEDELE